MKPLKHASRVQKAESQVVHQQQKLEAKQTELGQLQKSFYQQQQAKAKAEGMRDYFQSLWYGVDQATREKHKKLIETQKIPKQKLSGIPEDDEEEEDDADYYGDSYLRTRRRQQTVRRTSTDLIRQYSDKEYQPHIKKKQQQPQTQGHYKDTLGLPTIPTDSAIAYPSTTDPNGKIQQPHTYGTNPTSKPNTNPTVIPSTLPTKQIIPSNGSNPDNSNPNGSGNGSFPSGNGGGGGGGGGGGSPPPSGNGGGSGSPDGGRSRNNGDLANPLNTSSSSDLKDLKDYLSGSKLEARFDARSEGKNKVIRFISAVRNWQFCYQKSDRATTIAIVTTGLVGTVKDIAQSKMEMGAFGNNPENIYTWLFHAYDGNMELKRPWRMWNRFHQGAYSVRRAWEYYSMIITDMSRMVRFARDMKLNAQLIKLPTESQLFEKFFNNLRLNEGNKLKEWIARDELDKTMNTLEKLVPKLSESCDPQFNERAYNP